MKKIFVAFMMCVMAVTASAQLKSVDVKADLRGDFGLGAGVTLGLAPNLDFAPNFNYYFVDGGNCFTLDGDFHYNINLDNALTLYPLAGVLWYHAKADDVTIDGHKVSGASWNKLGINLGCGLRYDLNAQWGIFAEAKYQFIVDADGADDTFFSLGVNYKF